MVMAMVVMVMTMVMVLAMAMAMVMVMAMAMAMVMAMVMVMVMVMAMVMEMEMGDGDRDGDGHIPVFYVDRASHTTRLPWHYHSLKVGTPMNAKYRQTHVRSPTQEQPHWPSPSPSSSVGCVSRRWRSVPAHRGYPRRDHGNVVEERWHKTIHCRFRSFVHQ